MAVKEKRESLISHVLIKFGVALAFSVGGVVYTFLRIRPSKSKHSPSSLGKGSEADSRGESGACALEDSSLAKLSPSSGFILAEVDQLINEHNMCVQTNDVSPNNGHSSFLDFETCTQYERAGHEERDLEITNLRNKIEILEERERILEMQLLEYYGLEEQETNVMELQNRISIHNTEAKLYNLKIESLQSDNRILEAQLADYEKVVIELESAKAKIKFLRKKLRSEAEQNREHILRLQERVMKLQDGENNDVQIDRDVQMQLRKMKDLEEELDETEKTNECLKLENSELAHKLQYIQMLAPSALDDKEIQALKEESHLLRHQKEELRKEIDQLRADRCADIEELVYLRWINACLRYEMRNYQPGPGETIARDLSKTLSPKSEKKAKQLILDYANKEGSGDHAININDIDSDQWSTFYFTGSCEPDDIPFDNSSAANKTNKLKVFAKLMKLLRGKDGQKHTRTQPSIFERASSVDGVDIGGHFGNLGVDGVIKTIKTSSGVSSANSIDLQRSCSRGRKSTTGESSYGSRRGSDDGSLSIFRRIDSITGYDDNLSSVVSPREDAQNGAKTELLKYAEALKKSHSNSSVGRRSASYSSF